jgi:hypothetical protein
MDLDQSNIQYIYPKSHIDIAESILLYIYISDKTISRLLSLINDDETHLKIILVTLVSFKCYNNREVITYHYTTVSNQ